MNIEITGESIRAFVRGPSLQLSSSTGLRWENISIERHIFGLGEKPETITSCPLVTLASGLQVLSGESAMQRGPIKPYSKPPGTMNLMVQGAVPAVYPSTQTELIVCAMDPIFIEEVAAEQESRLVVKLRERICFRDDSLSSLVRLIEEEAKSNGASGALYIDHLTYALVLRLLNLETKRDDTTVLSNSLPHVRLKRVIERMEADLDKNIDLKTLAVESGYSVTHFLRMFRAATGCSPLRYLSQLRVKRAQEMMNDQAMHLIDIALACGFSSHAQLSRVFRQIVGVPPSEYRRSM